MNQSPFKYFANHMTHLLLKVIWHGIQLALIMQLSDSTEGLHGWFGHIPISSGATAVLVFCGFVSGSVIINVISWTRVLKPCLNYCIPCAYTHIITWRKLFHNELRTMPKCCIAAGCSTSNGEGYTQGYSLHAFLRYESTWKKWRMGQLLIQYV